MAMERRQTLPDELKQVDAITPTEYLESKRNLLVVVWECILLHKELLMMIRSN